MSGDVQRKIEEMSIIGHWRHGFGILIRLFFLSAVLSIGLAPVLLFDDPFRASVWGFVFSLSYFVIILPFFLPWFLEIAGMKIAEQSEIEGSEGMNEASIAKQDELRKEQLGKISSSGQIDHQR